MRYLKIPELLLAVLFTLMPFNSASLAEPVKLGYLLDLSAKGSFMGQQSRNGAELARKELAASGVNVEIVFEDHRTDAKTGLSGAKNLIDVKKVDAILCDLTPACIAASPAILKSGKLMMYQAPVTSILETNPYAFKNFLDYQEGCKRIAEYWKQSGITQVAHFKINAEFGDLCLEGSKEVFNNQQELPYDPNDDLRSLVSRVKSSGAQAIFQTGYEADYISMFKASSDLGLFLPVAMPQPLLTQTIVQSVNPAVLAKVIAFGFPELPADFISRLKAENLYQSEVSIESAAIAYMHVKQLVSAISSCAGRDIDCQRSHLSASGPMLGFKGWKGREADYDYVLRSWSDGQFTEIK